MIINHSKRFIFFKTTKTASSSTEKLLSSAFSKDDIFVTGSSTPFSRFFGLWSHIAPSEARLKLFPADFDNYTLIANFRNPWDRMVSEFFWESSVRRRHFQEVDAPEALRADFGRYVKKRIRVQPVNKECAELALKGKLRPIFYENLEESIADLLREYGVDNSVLNRMPQINSTTRPTGSQDYRALYSDVSQIRVGKMYYTWIRLGGYRF
jgi:hypothetical protein